ncbi:TPA: hypothetical protein RQN07_002752 [Aeromonas dhakensis]|uniref:hypothetical protein n=1 Tax=Aeromonas dhakensis TaxID=196024 RepID=UPI00288FDB92|nr:hypothetical protein [Aeromonas dhakensis]HDX8469020.1 hypothetical protein [Aeromonas dhakensis]HDZ8869535.1 hypothetical protein [Aeromonas dhakensis]HDZ8931155.1 hypothetical protein [Aeromonas dhakensis]HEA3208361.1 hypothetical protein [Aeromonas dhakensis]
MVNPLKRLGLGLRNMRLTLSNWISSKKYARDLKKHLANEKREAAKAQEELNKNNLILHLEGKEVDKFIIHKNKVYRVFTTTEVTNNGEVIHGDFSIIDFEQNEVTDESLWIELLGRINNG